MKSILQKERKLAEGRETPPIRAENMSTGREYFERDKKGSWTELENANKGRSI
jgi:hypothetical protein